MWGWAAFSWPFFFQDLQAETVLSFACGSFQVGTGDFLFVLSFSEMHHRNGVSLGELRDGFDIGLPDLAKSGRGRDLDLPLPAKKDADLPHRLQLRQVSLKENAIEGTTLECHPVPK
jgi:hypothetical protein